jgi:hypothetical protein
MIYEDQNGNTWFKEDYIMLPQGMRESLRVVTYPDLTV